MPHLLAQSNQRPSASPILSTLSVGVGLISIALLIAGSVSPAHAHVLLAWGLLGGVACVGLTCVIVVGGMIDEAVNRCVTRLDTAVEGHVDEAVTTTAVKVGQAIAEGLADESPQPPRQRAGVLSIY